MTVRWLPKSVVRVLAVAARAGYARHVKYGVITAPHPGGAIATGNLVWRAPRKPSTAPWPVVGDCGRQLLEVDRTHPQFEGMAVRPERLASSQVRTPDIIQPDLRRAPGCLIRRSALGCCAAYRAPGHHIDAYSVSLSTGLARRQLEVHGSRPGWQQAKPDRCRRECLRCDGGDHGDTPLVEVQAQHTTAGLSGILARGRSAAALLA
jgi:hypothetical protein